MACCGAESDLDKLLTTFLRGYF